MAEENILEQMSLNGRIVRNLKSLRKQKGYTQRKLAQKVVDESQGYGEWPGYNAEVDYRRIAECIKDYERGDTVPDVERAVRIAGALGYSMERIAKEDFDLEPLDAVQVGENVRFLREEMGFASQRQMAKEFGMDPKAVSSWERGAKMMSLEKARIFAENADVTPFDLLYQDITWGGEVYECCNCKVRIKAGQKTCPHCHTKFRW